MLLIIENKDDPTDPIAEETDGDAELVYIPVITAPTESDAAQLEIKCVLDRMSYDFRANGTESESIAAECRKPHAALFESARSHRQAAGISFVTGRNRPFRRGARKRARKILRPGLSPEKAGETVGKRNRGEAAADRQKNPHSFPERHLRVRET